MTRHRFDVDHPNSLGGDPRVRLFDRFVERHPSREVSSEAEKAIPGCPKMEVTIRDQISPLCPCREGLKSAPPRYAHPGGLSYHADAIHRTSYKIAYTTSSLRNQGKTGRQ